MCTEPETNTNLIERSILHSSHCLRTYLQKGGVPAAPSGTATLLRLSPNYQFRPRPLLNGYGLQAPPAFMA